MKTIHPQIVATVGNVSEDKDILHAMLESGMDVARLNFSWGTIADHERCMNLLREFSKEFEKPIPMIADLPGPRIQEDNQHTYDHSVFELTEKDKILIEFAITHGIEYIALSFVSSKKEIETCREIIKKNNGSQKIIAKIERTIAFKNIDEIIEVADAIMIARGDLGNEVPVEQIPFVETTIIKKCNDVGKPVITATGLLLSMTQNDTPSRAEVTDIAYAIMTGSDALMLSDETAIGKNPAGAILMMKKIITEALKHVSSHNYNNL